MIDADFGDVCGAGFAHAPTVLASMGIYVFTTDYLVELLNRDASVGTSSRDASSARLLNHGTHCLSDARPRAAACANR